MQRGVSTLGQHHLYTIHDIIHHGVNCRQLYCRHDVVGRARRRNAPQRRNSALRSHTSGRKLPHERPRRNSSVRRKRLPPRSNRCSLYRVVTHLVNAYDFSSFAGHKIHQALEVSVAKYPVYEGRFPQVAGMRFTFDAKKPAGKRIKAKDIIIEEEVMKPKKVGPRSPHPT